MSFWHDATCAGEECKTQTKRDQEILERFQTELTTSVGLTTRLCFHKQQEALLEMANILEQKAIWLRLGPGSQKPFEAAADILRKWPQHALPEFAVALDAHLDKRQKS